MRYEYIVVGSGAGGGVVAARLAQAGHSVLLLEAGNDPKLSQGAGPVTPDRNRLPEDYEVPTFHPMASENNALKWDFFVRHYANDVQQKRDDKFYETYDGKKVDGVLYPRAGTLGGCTAHNAMIMVYPNNADWDHVAQLTGDPSWGSRPMRRYFQRLENCRHRPIYEFIYRLTGWNPTKHGFSGWLSTEKAIPKNALKDKELVDVVEKSVWTALWELSGLWDRILWFFKGKGDPNDWRLVKKNAFGVHYPPLHTHRHARNGAREFVLDVARRHPDRLKIELDALVTEVLFDEYNRAVGVAYMKGQRLYRASYQAADTPGQSRTEMASREVILSGGAFNTPQLLMLSGIGPKDELEALGIRCRVNLPGVGKGLQDRYEVGVVNKLVKPWAVLKDATFTRDDPQFKMWSRWRKGVYTTNGAAIAVINRSQVKRPVPDLFMFALLGKFKGYFPGYSKLIADNLDVLTWCILKAHTLNHGGTVKLRSKDPRDPPLINFHYFEEGTDKTGEDLDSVVDGIKFVRTLTAPIADLIVEEELPGKAVQTDEQLRAFVRDNAWGHHASCTCAIGPNSDPNAVLDSNFRVRGTEGLRVVDASVFPKIPGMFIVSAVYMIAEKAADAILAAAGQTDTRCLYGQGFWCRVGNFFRCIGRAICCALCALKPVAKVLAGLIGSIVVLLLLIAAVCGLFIEPPSSNPDVNKEPAIARAIIDGFKANPLPPLPPPGGSNDPLTNLCARATVTVAANISPKLAVGFLAAKPDGSKSYKAWVRFGNNRNDPNGYRTVDFHRMAVKLIGVSGERLPGDESNTQDLMFASHDGYFAGDPQQFDRFFGACRKDGGTCRGLKNPYVLWHFITHPHGAWNLYGYNKKRPTVQDIAYTSVGAADLGSGQQVRYSAVACDQQTQYGKPGKTAYYLQERLQNRLDPANNNHVCFDLRVKVRTTESVENALTSWGDDDWLKVATIDIPPQTIGTSAQQAFCEGLSFTPWHGLVVHKPLGGLNRVFREVLPALHEDRLKVLKVNKVTAPTGDEVFK